MMSKKFFKDLSVIACSAMLGLSTIQSAFAAPGTLPQVPLFLSTVVEPNIYFTLDDSSSMTWNTMVKDGTGGLTASGGRPYIDGERRDGYSPTFHDHDDVVPPAYLTDLGWRTRRHNREWDKGWVVLNHIGNKNYYNPNVTYTPWPGIKDDGTRMFTQANPWKVLKDPWKPNGEKMNLCTYHRFREGRYSTDRMWIPIYYNWVDDNQNGKLDQTDTHTPVRILCSDREIYNFANWFQYYRTRFSSAKSIIGALIHNTNAARMGLRTFNGEILKDSKNKEIHVQTMSDDANKRKLLDAFYNYPPRRGTPMRQALEAVGKYFDNTGPNAPILDAANGGECQQNFNILLGDGYWNGDDPDVGNADHPSAGFNNTRFDGYTGDPDRPRATDSNDGGNYGDNVPNTLADVAMHDYERDLRPDLANKVPTKAGIDEASHQHLVTYTIAFGIEGNLDFDIDPATKPPRFWPNPNNGSEAKIDDMLHAAYNGRGQFFSAQQPDELQAALTSAIEDIVERTASLSAVAVNSTKLTQDSLVYVAQFNTNRWQGDLLAFEIDPETGVLETSPKWSAADDLDTRNLTTNPRTILTHNGNDGVPFQWSRLSWPQKLDLRTNPAGGRDNFWAGRARLNYLRGSRTDEDGDRFFRKRLTLLGDTINSSPVYVGKPRLNWPDRAPFPTAASERYSNFKNGPMADRDPIVYINANDGMLHGFAAEDGHEEIAYIPNILFSSDSGAGMHYLTDPSYSHRYYNDLTPTVSDVYASLGGSTEWHTILISGLRGGGRGVFALNVTDPARFSEGNAASTVVWEFTSNDDPDLGYTYSRPQIGMANNGRWYAILGNGYNDTGDGSAKLFILDIERGADGSWDTGDYIEIDTGSGTPANRNGLGTPVLADVDGDGTFDRAYAGDLRGQMWAFDLSDPSSAAWEIPDGKPLFTTVGGQPLTAQPTTSIHPSESDTSTNSPNIMVYFGSGQYLTQVDKTTTNADYFYGVWDRGDTNLDSTDLVKQTWETRFAPFRVLTNKRVNYRRGDYGWYIPLPDTGERSVTRPVVRGEVVFFNTFVPNSDPCSAGGYGYRMAVDLETGGSPDSAVFDVDGDGKVSGDGADSVGPGGTAGSANCTTCKNTVSPDGPDGPNEGFQAPPIIVENHLLDDKNPEEIEELPIVPKGRFGWQELIQ